MSDTTMPVEKLEPCPFCGSEMRQLAVGNFWLHPRSNPQEWGCILADFMAGDTPENRAAWNARPAATQKLEEPMPVAWPRIKSWSGVYGSAEGNEIPLGMARCLEQYADIKPTEGRLLWSMRAAAKWMRDIVALGPLYTHPAPQVTVSEDRLQSALEAYKATASYPMVPANHSEAMRAALSGKAHE